MEKNKRDLKIDLRKHRHLRGTIRFQLSRATAKAHGSTYISVEWKEINLKRQNEDGSVGS